MIRLSEKTIKETPDTDEYFHYEANYKAHLYHTLLLNGVNYEDLHLEWRPDKEKVGLDHVDLWYQIPDENCNFLIEVKQVYGMNRAKNDIRPNDYRVRDSRSKELKSGIIKDAIKLSESCGTNGQYYGIMLMYWADARVEEDLSIDAIRKSVLRQLREERPRIRVTNIELLWSSVKKTTYISLT